MNPAHDDSDKMRGVSLIILRLATIAFSLLMIPMGMATIMSPMAFDSGKTLSTWLLVCTVCSFIPLTLISIPASWFIHHRRSYRAAILVSLVPLISIMILTAIFISGAVYPAR